MVHESMETQHKRCERMMGRGYMVTCVAYAMIRAALGVEEKQERQTRDVLRTSGLWACRVWA